MTPQARSSSRGRASNGCGSPLLRAYRQHQRASVLNSLESLLTHPNGFALTTATPLQRQLCRLVEGAADLDASSPELLAAAGDCRHLVGTRPREVTIVAAVRSAKTLLCAAAAVHATQVVDVSALKPGEIPRVSILSLTLDLAQVAQRHLVGSILASPVLRELLVGDPRHDSITLLHPTGRHVEICTVAGRRGGESLISRWSAGLIVDEAARMGGEDDAVVNFDEARRVMLGRLLPGAQILAPGSPWAPFGPVFDQVQADWRRPSPDRVVVRATGPEMNPTFWTPDRCAALLKSDPDAYRVDCAAEFAAPESSLVPPDAVAAATRSAGTLAPDPQRVYVAAMDAATRGNAWTLIIMSRDGDKRRVDLAAQWVGSKNSPLSAGDTLREIAKLAAQYRVAQVWCDQWSADPLTELAQQHGLLLYPRLTPARERWEQAARFRTDLLDGRIELHPDAHLREDLLRVRRVTTSQGVRLDLPTAGDGRHCDFIPSLMLATAQFIGDKRPTQADRTSDAWYEAEARKLEAKAEAFARKNNPQKRW